jgi:hypothetical protein
MLFKSKKSTISISVARGVLESVFDECDRYEADENRRPSARHLQSKQEPSRYSGQRSSGARPQRTFSQA